MSVPEKSVRGGWGWAVVVVGLLLWAQPAGAQELETVLTVGGGSGISLGQGDPGVLSQVSPIFVDVDLGLIFDDDHSLEWTPGLMMELQGRVSVGINPSVKKIWQKGPLGVYGAIGFPFFFAPFTLLGVEPAVGAFFEVMPRLALALELHTDVFFAGGDLPEDSVLAKMDLAFGVRFDL